MPELADKYAWRPGMGEISGFGGGYEDACRKMLRAGLEWLDARPHANPSFQPFFNLAMETNDDAKALEAAILAVEPGCSGAMFGAVVRACLFVRKHGWEEYCATMTAAEARRARGETG